MLLAVAKGIDLIFFAHIANGNGIKEPRAYRFRIIAEDRVKLFKGTVYQGKTTVLFVADGEVTVAVIVPFRLTGPFQSGIAAKIRRDL